MTASSPPTPACGLLQAVPTRAEQLYSEQLDEHIVITVKGTSTQQNQPVALILAVDCSGSMAMTAVHDHRRGRSVSKLDMVKHSLRHLAGEMADNDLLALIGFDHEVYVHSDPARADETGKAEFRRRVDGLKARGNTNISQALEAALALAREMPVEAQTRIILLTDGQANAGMTDPEQLCGLLDGAAGRLSVSTIGVGTGCDHALLAALADVGLGGYGFVEHETDIARVIGSELGSILETAASGARVVVTPARGVTLTCLERCETVTSGGATAHTVELGALRVGVERNVVFQLSGDPIARPHVRPVTVATVTMEAEIDRQQVKEQVKVRVLRGRHVGPTDTDATAAAEKAALAKATREAKELAEAGRRDAAAELLRSIAVSAPLAVLANTLADGYQHETPDSAIMAASAYTVLRGGALNGASEKFASQAANTLGSWTTDSQRYYAATLSNLVLDEMAGSGHTANSTQVSSATNSVTVAWTPSHPEDRSAGPARDREDEGGAADETLES